MTALDPSTAGEWLAASPAALACADALGTLRWANAACAGLLGGDEAVRAGRTLAEGLALDAATSAGLLDALAAGGRVEVQRGGAGSGGEWLAIDVRALADGSRILALSSIQGARAAQAQAQRLAELLDLARTMGRLGIFERDLPSDRGHWDSQVFRMRGMHGSGESPPFEEAIRAVVDADRPGFEQAFRLSLEQPGSYAHRYRVRGVDGTVRQLHSQWVVKAGADGRPERVLGLIMDDSHAWTLARSYDEMVSQLEMAVDLAGIAIWRNDLATGRVHCNRQAYQVLDIEPRPGGLTADELRSLIHPDDLAQVQASAEAALQSGRPGDMEARFRRRDSSWRTLLMRRVVQRDPAGQALAIVGVALDVTERIDESHRAVELGRRFELATRAAGIGYWSLDRGAARARWSDQLRAMHGLPADAPVPTLDEWLANLVHPEDRAAVQSRFADWVKTGRGSLEVDFRILRPDGQVRHVITHSRVEGRDEGALLFGLVIDVTERRSAELALRQAGERAALAARGAGLGAWELDLRDGSSYWDEQMWRLRGLAPRPEPPTPGERLALVHPDDRTAVQRQLEESLAADAPSNFEFRVVWPDGSLRWLASRSAPVHDEHGRTLRRIGVNWDVTDSRTAEAVRQDREIARRESQAKSKFLARMSHELRTPLNAVLGFAQLLLADEGGVDAAAAQRRRRLEHIRSAGQHLLELINDVLDLSSLEGGEIRIALQPVPLAPLVAQTLPLVESLARQHGVELVCGPLDVVPMADVTRLRQVLLNLLTNAVKYNRPGGRVVVEAAQRGDVVIVRVADTGRGMSDIQLRHLFEPFNRLGLENQSIEGTGIGLAIVKALVERMGGSVHVDSTLGAGSLFELRLAEGSLPLTPPPVADPAPPVAPAGAERRPRGTLLYVEDNPVNALIIAELIGRRSDLELHIAEDGLDGVRKALELRPDLILLDMQLPDIDGHEVMRRLRADAATAAIPVIALSANAMPEDIDRALRAGMSDYWTKPLDFRAFMASIDALFGSPPR